MLVFEHARLLDCTGADPRPNMAVIVDGDRIRRVGPSGGFGLPRDADVIDCQGRTLMPGLTDAHVHFAAIEMEMEENLTLPGPVVALRIAAVIEEALQAGFTTVRDAGGLPAGYREAVRLGLIDGPDILISGAFISQTGGHGDHRIATDVSPPGGGNALYAGSFIADGVDQVLWAARENLRRGADQIKVMANGGAMSPTDSITAVQYTVAELAAAVQAAKAAGTYVLAHTYTPESMRNCVEAGIRSLEHGNFLDEPTAQIIKQHGAFLVPTIVVYEQIAAHGAEAGVGEYQMAKIRKGLDGAFEALAIAVRAGVTIASGSDLLGPLQPMRGREPVLKARAMGALGALIATTRTNAELFRMEDEIGTVEEGKRADLIVVDGDPTTDIERIADPANVQVVVKHGRVRKDLQREAAALAGG